jgi:hypothetical protein
MWARGEGIGTISRNVTGSGGAKCHHFYRHLNACASVAAFDGGRCIKEQVILYSLKSNVFVGSSLVDMYAKSGSVDDA